MNIRIKTPDTVGCTTDKERLDALLNWASDTARQLNAAFENIDKTNLSEDLRKTIYGK